MTNMFTDVHIFDTFDGGDVTRDLEIRDGLESSVYLSLFGGNIKDDGRENNPFKWWGNIDETVPARLYQSETAYLLKTVTPTPKNLRRIEDAANRDLNWIIADKFSKTLTVAVSMPKLNYVKIIITLDGIDPLVFQSSWGERDDTGVSFRVPPPVVTINNGSVLGGTGLANATLWLVLANGDVLTVPIDNFGNWSIEPYPLAADEIATAFVKTGSGPSSVGVTVIGVSPLYYDGSALYDGSQFYDGGLS